MTVSYPRLAARTLNFTLGIPRTITLRGTTVFFVRTAHGTDRVGQLWSHAAERGVEQLIVDPRAVLGDGDENLSEAERSRRERAREATSGIINYSIDEDGRWLAFALSGKLFATHIAGQVTRELPAADEVIDPHIDPAGRMIAYASQGSLRVISHKGENDRALVEPESDTVTWGQAEFIAAEELDRHRGFWWAPDSSSLLVTRVDVAPVQVWHIAEPAEPSRPAQEQRYPAAGTPNAEVRLFHLRLDGSTTEILWDRERFEYLSRVNYDTAEPLIEVLSRDQKTRQVLAVDPISGGTTVLRETSNPAWVEVIDTPRWSSDKRLVTVEDTEFSRQLLIDGQALTPGGWYVRGISHLSETKALITYSDVPHSVHAAWVGFDGSVEKITEGEAVHQAWANNETTVIMRADLENPAPQFQVFHRAYATSIAVLAENPPVRATPELIRVGEHDVSVAVFFPSGHEPGSNRLPVLMDPYGGPHFQRVLANQRMHLTSQWLADQGFVVIVADGRGTPGVNPRFERAIMNEFARVTLEDQVTALNEVAARFGADVDTSRVGITGWSYGGYLAALAVLQRPDVFHAAVAGAPVTEWQLYDTGYTERYLGNPNTQPEVYHRNSLTHLAPQLRRPLMLIHGLADDNVVAAHTLRLSAALLAHGKAHTVLPLVGVTHMTPQEEVAENLKLLQVEFLKDALSS